MDMFNKGMFTKICRNEIQKTKPIGFSITDKFKMYTYSVKESLRRLGFIPGLIASIGTYWFRPFSLIIDSFDTLKRDF